MDGPEYVTVSKASRETGWSPSTIRRYAEAGKVRYTTNGRRHFLVVVSDLPRMTTGTQKAMPVREPIYCDGYALIPLSSEKFAKVDIEDAERLALQCQWTCQPGNYAVGTVGTNNAVYMHRFLVQTDAGEVDHINGDTLDNRKSNLRPAAHRANMKNIHPKTRHRVLSKGVTHDPGRGLKPYRARITVDGSVIFLGRFTTEEDAAHAYNAASESLHGEYGVQNVTSPAMPE